MSTERPLQTRPDYDPGKPDTGTVPDRVPEYTQRTDTFNETNPSDRRRLGWAVKLGVPAAALALTAGIVFGKNVLATNNNPDAGHVGDRPTATAPAVPGQTHESAPATAFDPNNYKTWSADHVPLVINGPDGKVDNYDSVKAYAESLMIPGMTPEELSKDPKQYANQLLAAVNSYIASVSNPEAYTKYANVPAPDVHSIGSTGAVLDQYVKPGFEQAVTGEPEKGAGILPNDNLQGWLGDMNKLGHNYNHFNHVTDGQYKAAWHLDQASDVPSAGYTTYDPNTGIIHIFMRVNLVDNMRETSLNGQQNADGSTVESLDTHQVWNMDVQEQTVNGKQALRIVSIVTEQRTTM
jgi:hypothetical protein